MNVYNTIIKKVKNEKMHMTLIDPATSGVEGSVRIARDADRAGTDYLLVGGSTNLSLKDMDESVLEIKKQTDIPVIIFPGSSKMFTQYADAMFFMSLLNSRDREFIMDHQVKAARLVKSSGIETIGMGYLIFEPGMTVGRVGKAKLIKRDDCDLAADYAIASELLGMKLIYLEAGSGAEYPINENIISEVRKNVSIPLIVGGGIRDGETAKRICDAGADIIVTGTVVERARDVYDALSSIISAIK